MSASKPQGFKGALSFTRELLAIVISIISFIISTVNVYVTNLKAPDLSLTVAPFVLRASGTASPRSATGRERAGRGRFGWRDEWMDQQAFSSTIWITSGLLGMMHRNSKSSSPVFS